MKKKLYITRTVKLVCLFLALTLTFGILQSYVLCRIDANSIRLEGYYQEEKDSLDVVLLGASEVYTGFSSGLAYDKYGFTSYPFASESITADGTLLALKEIVRTQKPQLIVIELNAYLYAKDSNESHDAHIRKLIDNIPLNENKIEYISNNVPPEEQLEYYLPLIKYHGTWSDIPKMPRLTVTKLLQQMRGTSYLKGFRTTTNVFKPTDKVLNHKLANETGTKKLNPVLEQKLRDLLDYCKEQKLDNVVFLRTPHLVYSKTYDRVKRANCAGEIVQSYGFPFINLERDFEKIGIAPETDFYNYDHMNIYGTVKMTEYLSAVLCRDYHIRGRELSAKQKENWDKAGKYFHKLYQYCDYLIKEKHEKVQLMEDINTLQALEKY